MDNCRRTQLVYQRNDTPTISNVELVVNSEPLLDQSLLVEAVLSPERPFR
jgi:hypothetical protein